MENPKIRFKGFTKDWEQRKLGDVIDDMYNGQTPSRNKSEYWNGTIKWLSSGELNRGTVYDSIETITEEGKKAANLKIVPKGTFVMAITGLEAAGTRGNCALLGFDTTLNQSCMALFPKQEMLTSEFLFQWYRKVGEEYGINYTQGTKQQSYNAELIKILPISLPSVVEQRKISSYLSHLDHLITLHQRKCEQTKKLKKYMLQKMFPQNGAKVPEIRFDGFIYDWEQRKVSEITKFHKQGFYTTEEYDNSKKYYLLRGTDLTENKLVLKDTPKIDATEKDYDAFKTEIGDFLIVRSGTVGTYGIVDVDIPAIFGSYLIDFRFDMEQVTNEFFGYFYQSSLFKSQLNKIIQASANTNINAENIKSTVISLPSLNEQRRISEYLGNLDNLITLHQRKCDELKKMKKYMLQNMFI